MRFVELKRDEQLAYRCQRLRPARQGMLIASRADGVPRLTQAVLGTPFLGSRLLLCYERQHHGRCHTSVSSRGTYRRQPVVVQFHRVQHTDNPSSGWAQPRRYQPKGSGRATNDTGLVGFLADQGTLEIEISGERLSLDTERGVTVLRAPLRRGRPRLQRALDE
jgi:hypothetical protein